MPRWIEESTESFFRNRWMILIVGIWIECCAGASYGFGIYSEDLKTNFGYSQQDLEIISFFKDMGECVGLVSGLMYEKFSPWVVLLVGAIQNHLGYLLIWLSVTHRVPKPALWQMCLYMSMAINSQTYLTTATMVTSVKNFPANRGIVIGLMKGCIGLSDAILTRIWRAIPLGEHNHGGSSFILVVSLVPTIVTLLCMPAVHKIEQESREKIVTSKFTFVSVPIVVLAIFLMGLTFAVGFDPATNRILGFIVLLTLISPLGVLLLKTETEDSSLQQLEEPFMSNDDRPMSSAEENHAEVDIERHIDWREARKSPTGEVQSHYERQIISENSPGVQLPAAAADMSNRSPLSEIIMSGDFILLWVSSAMALGTGFVAINNVGQVAASQSHRGKAIHAFISVISIWQFLGRFGAGAFSDYVVNERGIPRPLLIAAGSICLSLSYFLVATSLPGTLYMGSILIGFCFGALYSLVPTITSELFGLHHFATLYNVVLMGNPVVSYILSVWVAGYFYDKEAEKQRRHSTFHVVKVASGNSGDCKGSACFDLTFIILGGVCLVATIGFVTLWMRSKKFYKCGICKN
eukprot:Gb_26168 [translate_table: standard]